MSTSLVASRLLKSVWTDCAVRSGHRVRPSASWATTKYRKRTQNNARGPNNLGAVKTGNSAPAMAPQLWALDFDGVVCDSVGESNQSAWKAAAKVWPEVFNTQEAESQKHEVLEKMRAVRPVVETGYENIVQVRCLLEGVGVDDMLANWHQLLGEYMAKWKLDRSELVHQFGSTRDEWMKADMQGWLGSNAMYPGVPDALKRGREQHEVYIVTTKQARFTEVLLRDMAGVPIPADRIFSQAESGAPKSEVLHQLQAKHSGADCHFVEDKLSTLEKVSKEADLQSWQLYLVDWGYNTAAERKRAASNQRIHVINSHEFAQLLADGVSAAVR